MNTVQSVTQRKPLRDEEMRKPPIVAIGVVLLFLFQYGAFAEDEATPSRPNFRIQIEFHFTEWEGEGSTVPSSMQSSIKSYFLREFRSLGDVEIVENKPTYRLRVDCTGQLKHLSKTSEPLVYFFMICVMYPFPNDVYNAYVDAFTSGDSRSLFHDLADFYKFDQLVGIMS